jgi:hypothetical protein
MQTPAKIEFFPSLALAKLRAATPGKPAQDIPPNTELRMIRSTCGRELPLVRLYVPTSLVTNTLSLLRISVPPNLFARMLSPGEIIGG